MTTSLHTRPTLAGLILLAVTAACATPTGTGNPGGVDLRGQWTYTATQTSVPTASLSGTLAISTQSGNAFGGVLDVIEMDAQGQSHHLNGLVSGQLVDTAAVDFDAFFDVTGRRHLGVVRGDSIHGTWVEQDVGGTSSGAFAGRRTSR
jgi:hypothetical protein